MIRVFVTWAAAAASVVASICDGVRVRLMTARSCCVPMHRVRGFMED